MKIAIGLAEIKLSFGKAINHFTPTFMSKATGNCPVFNLPGVSNVMDVY
jgi:hypothetical protein